MAVLAPTYKFTLDGVDLSDHFTADSWNVNQGFGRKGDTGTFYLHDEWLPGAQPNFVPKQLQIVSLQDTTTNYNLFAGVINTPKMQSISPNTIDWQLDCTDFTVYADNIIVNGDFIGLTADVILRELMQQANIGLFGNDIQPGPVIGRIQINYLPLSTAIVKLARMASQVADYGWFIDYNYNVHFFSFLQVDFPRISFTDNISGDPSLALGYYANDSTFAYEWDGGSLRNSVIVRGANYQGERTDEYRGTGNQTSWPIAFTIDTGFAPTLKVGGVTTKVQIMSAPTTTGSSSTVPNTDPWQISQNSNGQWFLISRNGAPANGRTISLLYRYVAPIIARVDNRASQAAHPGPNGGVFQMEISDGSLTSLSAALARGNAELQAFQWAQERVTFTTLENWTGHLNAGDTFNFTTSRVPDSQNGYRLGFTGQFMVVSNNYIGVAGNYRKYTITATRIV